MRYELRLYAYDVMDVVHVRLDVDGASDNPELPIERVLAMTATTRIAGSPATKDWTREVLETMLAAL